MDNNNMGIVEQFTWASQYAKYIEMRSSGLKKQAQSSLQNFITNFKLQSKDERRQFINSVYEIASSTNEYSLYLPNNLSEDIFKEEIYNWIKDEPNNTVPYRWSRDFELMKRAIEINPFDQETILLFGRMLINKISMNQHEIKAGFGYIGSPSDDLKLIIFFKPVINNINNELQRELFTDQINELEHSALKSII